MKLINRIIKKISTVFSHETLNSIKSECVVLPERNSYVHLDLGCFTRPRGANIGIDTKVPPTFPCDSKFMQCNLGFQGIPLPDNSCEFVTAFDVLEHIPKMLWFTLGHVEASDVDIFSSVCAERSGGMVVIKPSIFLMNEIFRVLKPGGQFLSYTPAIGRSLDGSNIKCFIPINQDPTHVNVWTYESFLNYFCPLDINRPELFQQQISNGIRTAFKALAWGAQAKFPVEGYFYYVGHDGTHLSMVLEKPDYNGKEVIFFSEG